MANRYFYNVQAMNKEIKIIAGHFDAVAASATKVQGLGYTVAKTGTGEYTITLDDPYNALISGQVTVEDSTPVDLVAQIDNHDVTGTVKTVVINLLAAASPTNGAATTKIHFALFLQNSSLPSV